MIVAVGTMHLRNGFFAAKNGFELNAFYVAAALALAFGGPGPSHLTPSWIWIDIQQPVDATVIGRRRNRVYQLTLRHMPGAGEHSQPPLRRLSVAVSAKGECPVWHSPPFFVSLAGVRIDAHRRLS